MNVLPDEYTLDNYMPRFSQDRGHVNNNGLLLLDFCKQTGLRIMNGRLGKDTGVGQYTFEGSRDSSVVDYILASQPLFKFAKEFEVHEPNILSDHCLISCNFEFIQQNLNTQTEEFEQVNGKYTWNSESKDEFIDRLEHSSSLEKLNILNTNISVDNNDIKLCLSDFVNIIASAAAPMYKKGNYDKNANVTESDFFPNKHENPWYNQECHENKIVSEYARQV